MGTVLLILLLLALCGFIAYIGDLLGRRLGKKRLSIFGLRPKHTAIVLTIVTGVLIAAFTFVAAVATLPWFRSVVTQGERLASQNATLRGQNRNLEQTIRERTEANGALEASSRVLTQTNERLRGENQNLQKTNQRLEQDNRSLQQSNTELKKASSRLLAQNGSLKTQNASLRGRNTQLASSNRQLAQQTRELEQQRKALDGQVQSLRQEVDRYRAGEYLFRRGDWLSRFVILAQSPPELLRTMIERLPFAAEKQVEELFGDMAQSIEFVPPLRYPADRPRTLRSYQEWVVSHARRIRNEDIVVQLVAAENCVPGRPLKLRYEWYVNSLVIRQSDELGSRLVDGAAAEGDILEELVFFLQMQVAPTVTSPPYSLSPGSAQVGELRYNRILPVVREIKDKNRWVEVVAVARQDTRRAGPLHLDFEVRDVAPEILGARLRSRPPGR